MKTPLFKGSCTALITPFDEHGVDYNRYEEQIEYQYEKGTSALVVCGTTGEAATLNENEHNELVRKTVQLSRGRMKVIAGIGSNDTHTALHFAENAKYSGADGVLMVTPYYNKTTQKGLAEHFLFVADRVEIPLILYNVPSRTGIGISADTYKLLSRHPNINGIKEASGDLSLAAKTRFECGDELFIWSGNDDNTIPLMALGALGVISVASNIVPEVIAKVCALCLEGKFPEATELYGKYSQLCSALFIETNPIPIKTAMKIVGKDSGIMRLPLTEMSAEHLEALREALKIIR